jgi:hypothetical protein
MGLYLPLPLPLMLIAGPSDSNAPAARCGYRGPD